MVPDPSNHFISSFAALEALYGKPSESAVHKSIDHLDALCQRFIAASPFMLLATSGSSGLDCSPRGDQPGFVEVADDKTLWMPDRRGNNRVDSLRNILHNPHVGLLFLIPGVHQCLRVNGSARISIDPVLLQRFTVDGIAPRSIVVVRVEQAFAQCARAVMRAGLWEAEMGNELRFDCGINGLPGAHTDGLDTNLSTANYKR